MLRRNSADAQRHDLAGRPTRRVARVDADDDLTDFIRHDGNGGTVKRVGHAATGGKDRVADRLRFEPSNRHATQQPIVRVERIDLGPAL